MRNLPTTVAAQQLIPTLRRHLRRAGEPALVRGDSPLFTHAPDSLEITRLAVRLSAEVGVQVPVRLLFEARTVDELALGIEELRGQAQPETSAGEPPGVPGHRRRRRLSFSQERMAFMQALSTGSAAYHVAFGLRLRGAVEIGALTRAVESLAARFEILATRFLPSPDGIVPLPVTNPSLTLRVITPPPDNAPAQETELRIATEFCNAPFDLETGDTARAALIRCATDSALLVFAFHHIVIDQWSYELLLEHVSAAYAHQLLGSPPPDGSQDSRFSEYVAWHRSWFRAHAFHRDRAYWVSQLEGASRVSFEPDQPRGALASFRGARWRLALPERTWQQLEDLALRERATLAMLLYATLALQLRNESGKDDLVIGLPVANRNHEESLGCFGTLVNTLGLRVRLDGRLSFVDFLAQVRFAFLGALEHQDMPFEVLIGQKRIERDPSVSPLFGVMLNVLNTPPANVAMPNLAVERVEIDRCGAQFDLTLTVDRLHTRSIWFEYATDLYLEATIERIARRYENLLESILEDPGRALDRLPQRTRGEATQIRRWSVGESVLAATGTTKRLLEAAVNARASHPAVVCGDDVLTHGELHSRASRLSESLLRITGGGPARIGIRMGRTPDLAVAVVGVLKAGLSFVPLDAVLPDERLAHISRDAGLALILAEDMSPARESWMPENVPLHGVAALVATGTAREIMLQAATDREAYVLYTSGSTGLPKGVSVTDHALANFLHSMQRRPGMRTADRLLAVTTLSFDIALLELLLPLTVGATVVLASREQARDGHALAALIASSQISVLQATPSTWMQLLEAGWHGDSSLRALVGGEPLPKDLATALLARTGELWNMYGPTESTVWSACARVANPVSEITVGRPINGTTIEIIDQQGRPAGIGVHGEILIGGAGLAREYVNLPELTASRFIRLSVDGHTSRYYRTGDLGGWTASGELRVLGRLDRQLKVRGHRIEPEDIESTAIRIPNVARALVSASPGSSIDKRLFLHVVSADGAPLDLNAVRSSLRNSLPEYMIPQIITQIESIPTLPNGKIDYRRLAQMKPIGGIGGTPASTRPAAPRELVLQRIWCELLGVPQVDRHQDFFELGGHSLLAMRLVTRVREELQKNCSLATVFQNPTIASLCTALDEAPDVTSYTLVPLQEDGAGTPLFCICGIQIYRPLLRELALDAPVFAAYVPTQSDISVQSLALEYLEVIRQQQPKGPYRLLGFSLGGVLALEIAQQLLASGELAEQLVILDSDVPGEAGPVSVKGVLREFRRVLGDRNPETAEMPDYLKAIRAYHARRYSGPAVFVEATRAHQYHPGYGWPDLIPKLKIIRFDSDHVDLLSEQNAGALARALRPVLSPRGAGTSSA